MNEPKMKTNVRGVFDLWDYLILDFLKIDEIWELRLKKGASLCRNTARRENRPVKKPQERHQKRFRSL